MAGRVQELTGAEARAVSERYPLDATASRCLAEARVRREPAQRWLCTREAGHDGPHVAWAPHGPVAMWGAE